MKKFIKSLLPPAVVKAIGRTKLHIKQPLRVLKAKTKVTLHRPLKEKPAQIRFEINLAEHCNLNCIGCMNFSCIAELELLDVEEFRRDFVRMGEIFSHECERIALIGGEPLLHPQITAIIKIARDNFPSGEIHILTNGVLLHKMSDDFWKACHEYDIGILISAYPIDIGYEAMKSKASSFGVSLNWAWKEVAGQRSEFDVEAINLKGDGNAALNFALCGRGITCTTLKHGRLFTCPFPAHVHHFNKRFNQNIIITEADYVDIYSDITADEILQRLSEPIPACRYCKKVRLPKRIKWGPTKRQITEWL